MLFTCSPCDFPPPLALPGLGDTDRSVAPRCLCRLGLDYDIFLLDRIVEMRQAGHSDDESISLGIAHTGRIITAAGTIMAVAFSGMLLSSSSTINMLSFYLTLAVCHHLLVALCAMCM